MKKILIFVIILMISCDNKKSKKQSNGNLYKTYTDSFNKFPNNYKLFMGKIKYMLKEEDEKKVYKELIKNKNNPSYDFYYIQAKLEKKLQKDDASILTIDNGINFYENLFKKNKDTISYLLNKYLLLSIKDEEKSFISLKKEILSLKIKDSIEENEELINMIREINKVNIKNL